MNRSRSVASQMKNYLFSQRKIDTKSRIRIEKVSMSWQANHNLPTCLTFLYAVERGRKGRERGKERKAKRGKSSVETILTKTGKSFPKCLPRPDPGNGHHQPFGHESGNPSLPAWPYS
jgi:hypothetical protein